MKYGIQNMRVIKNNTKSCYDSTTAD